MFNADYGDMSKPLIAVVLYVQGPSLFQLFIAIGA